MLRPNNMFLGCLLLASCSSSTLIEETVPSENAQGSPNELAEAVERFSEIVLSGEFERLRSVLFSDEITFDQDGDIEEGIACFLHWTDSCRSETHHVVDILKSDHFVYYYHIDDNSVIVSFIEEDSRIIFYENPSLFLENNYLSEYFSCHFLKRGSEWFLKESVCFSETEGPFQQEPEV